MERKDETKRENSLDEKRGAESTEGKKVLILLRHRSLSNFGRSS